MMTAVKQLLLATQNAHKLREIKGILKSLSNVEFFTLRDFPNYVAPEETGSSFEENAILKSTHAAKELGMYVLAEDSGLVVPALKGAPGIFSRRYAGENASDFDNRKKLLKEMDHFLDEDRYAYYECVIAISSPEGVQKTARATCEGSILSKEKGGSGFGYDSLFLKHGYNKSFGELSEALKNEVSHRRKALDRILPFLQSLCTD